MTREKLDETLSDEMRMRFTEELDRFIDADPTSFMDIMARDLCQEPVISLYMETSEWNWHLGEDKKLSDIILAKNAQDGPETLRTIHGLEQVIRRLNTNLLTYPEYARHPTLGVMNRHEIDAAADADLHPDWEDGVGLKDWQTYIGPVMRRIWHTLPKDTRTAMRIDAQDIASHVAYTVSKTAAEDSVEG